MSEPGPVPATHCYRAFRAALRALAAHKHSTDVFCPGLATGIGQVDPDDMARQMLAALLDHRH